MPDNELEEKQLNPRDNSPVYTISELKSELRQGEIISDLAQFEFDPVANAGVETTHEYAIVVGQDCDLLQDYNRIAEGKEGQLISVLIYKLFPATQISDIGAAAGREARKIVVQNKNERYHYLEAAPVELDLCSEGLPSLIVDFKRYFAMPPKEIYRQIRLENGAKRRCRLEMPYREHLQSRAAFYQQRVMLPMQHFAP